MAVDGQERRRHLIGHDNENVRRLGGHRADPLFRSLTRGGRRRPTFSVLAAAICETIFGG